MAHGNAFEEDLLVTDLNLERLYVARPHDPRSAAERELTPTDRRVIAVSSAQRRPPDRRAASRALLDDDGGGLRRAGHGHARLRAQERLRDRDRRRLRRHRLSLVATIAADALGPEHVVGVSNPSRYSSEGSIADARALADNLGIKLMIIPIEPAHAGLPADAGLAVRGHAAGHGGGEHPVAHPRQHLDGALEQVRLAAGADHRQQERDGHGLRDALRRHGRRLRRDQGRAEDAGLPPRALPQPARRPRPHPARRDREAAVGRAAPRTSSTPTRCRRTTSSTRSSRPTSRTTAASKRSSRWASTRPWCGASSRMVDRNEYKRRQAPPGVKITPRAFGRDRRLPITNRYKKFVV